MSKVTQPHPHEASLHYHHAEVPGDGELTEVAPGVYWLRMPLPFALDHINLWLLKDNGGWCIIDCGFASDATRANWEQIFANLPENETVTRLIVTHYHPDHIGLAAWLSERFKLTPQMALAEFLTAHAAANNTPGYTKEALHVLFHQHGLAADQLKVMAGRGNVYQKMVPELPATFRRIREGDALSINQKSWRVITGYGHAPEHCALYCAELNVLISGDMVLPRISTNVSVGTAEPDGDPLGLFPSSLDRYLELPEDTLVLPSHGKVFRGLHPRIAQLKAHHAERLDQLAAACRTPQTAVEVLPVLFKRELDTHQMYFAMGEAVAHLNYLMHRGELRRDLGEDGVYRFVGGQLISSPIKHFL